MLQWLTLKTLFIVQLLLTNPFHVHYNKFCSWVHNYLVLEDGIVKIILVSKLNDIFMEIECNTLVFGIKKNIYATYLLQSFIIVFTYPMKLHFH